jgi:hypothetical protein
LALTALIAARELRLSDAYFDPQWFFLLFRPSAVATKTAEPLEALALRASDAPIVEETVCTSAAGGRASGSTATLRSLR